ncbi:putative cation-transporting ATPase F [Patulibacter medicamentivorans]|uniref:Putative cation-transporting ATPase F n=1 Tax=Patulibacter medicamentivorans TaxID=1097667 RepID=H0E182_9ACTN|nr:HAD-IC family P-type ATPase [Patulibacter medicamentivorans]EHN12521.1 putative cation-transporting ATPase F [Patulibacter medicamentivorans]
MGAAWHARTLDDTLAALGTSAGGLAAAEARARRERYGPNVVERQAGPSAAAILLRQFTSPLIYALLASAAVAFALGELTDGAVVLAVVLANAAIGFVQEHRAGRAIEALAALVSDPATVLRDGGWTQRPAEELVPGDVVSVEAGDRVSADARLLRADALRADESALTGESLPRDKTTAPVPADAPLADRDSVVHAGTLVVAGRARAVVVETGSATELGRISKLLAATDRTQTPLTRGIAGLAQVVTRAIAAIAVLLLAVALLRGYPLADALMAAITLAVAAIPEGLPAIVTIALAVGVQRMARRRAIVRELPAVETLGSTTVVCSDKTGTLTRNEMLLRRAWSPAGELELDGTGYAARGTVRRDGREVTSVEGPLRELLKAAALATEARLDGEGDERTVLGDPTDGALLVGAERAGLDPARLRERHPRRALVPFDADRRWMASGHDEATYLKGAPEELLGRVSDPEPARAVLERYAADGLRVLAVAAAPAGSDGGDGELRLLGLVGLQDPAREGAADAVAACHGAGIDVKMITGDHAATAAAIGRELGIVGERPPLTGAEIDELDEPGLRERVRGSAVFARVAPEHKLRLVRALQADGGVVAMTGDGVNDAPALRQADIGVAMGRAGTAAAKEAADIVLGDDDFSTIRAAIEEGRRVYDNLVKALAFVLPTNLGEGLVILAAVLAFPIYDGQPLLPIAPVQVLWINLVATVSLALPLAFEAREHGLMARPPRPPDERLLSPFVTVRTIYVGVLLAAVAIALFLLSLDAPAGRPPAAADLARAQTLAVTSIAFFQIFYLLLCRSSTGAGRGLRANPAILIGIAALLVLHAGFVHLPVMHGLFGSTGLDAGEWLLAAAAGAVVVPVVTLEKAWRRRRLARA